MQLRAVPELEKRIAELEGVLRDRAEEEVVVQGESSGENGESYFTPAAPLEEVV